MGTNDRPDRNFDDLAAKFQKKVYGGVKGKVRLAILNKDIGEFVPKAFRLVDHTFPALNILDAGCGTGPFSLELAKIGHFVTLCDISEKMLEKAKEKIIAHDLIEKVQVCHIPILDLPKDTTFDLVLCHAVIDWVDDPHSLISQLIGLLKERGVLSLTFYNLHGMIFKNLLRTNYKKILNKEYTGWPGSLTPTYPREPAQVTAWLRKHRLEILCHSGIRVFHDYILDPNGRERQPETVLNLELAFSRKMPYRDLGRYQHILACKKVDTAIIDNPVKSR